MASMWVSVQSPLGSGSTKFQPARPRAAGPKSRSCYARLSRPRAWVARPFGVCGRKSSFWYEALVWSRCHVLSGAVTLPCGDQDAFLSLHKGPSLGEGKRGGRGYPA